MSRYTVLVLITSIRHAGIRELVLRDDASGLPLAAAAKIRRMLAFLRAAPDVRALQQIPLWKAHQLTGDRKGVWALHVTRNWRLTFRVVNNEIVEVDFEDYH